MREVLVSCQEIASADDKWLGIARGMAGPFPQFRCARSGPIVVGAEPFIELALTCCVVCILIGGRFEGLWWSLQTLMAVCRWITWW